MDTAKAIEAHRLMPYPMPGTLAKGDRVAWVEWGRIQYGTVFLTPPPGDAYYCIFADEGGFGEFKRSVTMHAEKLRREA